MSLMEIAKEDAFPAGTMKHFETGKMEILIANVGGKFYAINDRCPHMNAPLSMVVLQGTTVICPLHFSRFDVTTGKKSSGPVEMKIGDINKIPPKLLKELDRIGEAMAPVKTYDMEIFPVKVEGSGIFVDV